MKLKIVIIVGIIISIVCYSRYFTDRSQIRLKQKQISGSYLKNMQDLRLTEHSMVSGSLLVTKPDKQVIAKELQTSSSKSVLAKFSANGGGLFLPLQNNLLDYNAAAVTNYIIPIVDSSENAGGNSGGNSDNTLGMGENGGGGGSTTPVVNSVDADLDGNSTIIYISIYGSNNVIGCNVVKSAYNISATNGMSNSSGKTPTGVSGCSTVISGANNLNGPENLVVNNNHLYVVNYSNNGIINCDLSSSGNVSGCNNIMVPVESPVFITKASTQQLYVNSWPNGQDIAPSATCILDNSGNITNCGNPTTINLSLLPYPTIDGYSYTTNFNSNGINKCVGLNCQLLSNILMLGANNGPTAVIATDNNVYITNYDSLVACGIDQNSGNFFNCKVLSSNLNNAEGVAVYNTNS